MGFHKPCFLRPYFSLGEGMLGAGRSTSHKSLFFLEGFGSTPQKRKDNQPGSILYQAAFTKLLYSDIFHIDTYNNKKLNELLSIYKKTSLF